MYLGRPQERGGAIAGHGEGALAGVERLEDTRSSGRRVTGGCSRAGKGDAKVNCALKTLLIRPGESMSLVTLRVPLSIPSPHPAH